MQRASDVTGRTAPAGAGDRPRRSARVLLVSLLAVLWAAPGTAQEPREAGGERRSDAFDGPTIFDRSPDRGVSVSRLTLEAAEAPPLVSASDHYGAAFIADWARLRPRASTARVLRPNPLELEIPPTIRSRDRVVIALRGVEGRPGDMLQAVRAGRTLPGGGRVVQSVALVELTGVEGDSARGVVRSLFADYQVGDPLIVAEPFAVGDLRELEPAEETLVAAVVGTETPQALVGTNDRLFLDAGGRAGLEPGDELRVFERGTPDPVRADAADRLGVVRVVRVRPESSTARVVETRDVGIRRGAVAVLVRRPAARDR